MTISCQYHNAYIRKDKKDASRPRVPFTITPHAVYVPYGKPLVMKGPMSLSLSLSLARSLTPERFGRFVMTRA